MNYDDSPDEAAFRAELRAWLADNWRPPSPGEAADAASRRAESVGWHQLLAKGGYVGLTLPAEYGGRGLAPVYGVILNDELGRAGAPGPPAMVGYVGMALGLHGDDAQRHRWLPGLLDGTEPWCQGFSEPDAGSDLAGLLTTAIKDGDDYVVNGQKVWNGGADYAKWCFLLCRTNPELSKHRGISVVIVDMEAPGIDARTIRKISGRPDFSEIFFDDARVPVAHRIGDEGAGWSIAMSTLGYERGPSDIGRLAIYRRMLGELDDAYEGGRLRGGVAAGLALTRAHAAVDVLVWHCERSISARLATEAPGPEGSIDKLLMIRTEQELLHIATDLLGATVWTGAEPEWLHNYIWSRAASIYGGTEQIQKGIVATRVLGLPRDRA